MSAKLCQLIVLTCLLAATSGRGRAQTHARSLQFRSGNGLVVNVHNGSILVNGKRQFRIEDEDIIYTSKRNRLLDDSGSTFLFLEMFGGPNRDRLYVFQISANHIDSVADAISSDLKDLDGDGYLEFGGVDLNEVHTSRDSMYYLPSLYYEIRGGHVFVDAACTKKMDIQTNGVYLADPLDKDGNCCKVIQKPSYKRTYIVIDKGIAHERISGPANVRDTVSGALLFQLFDNVRVSTTNTVNKWYRIGLSVDLDPSQNRLLQIEKGSRIYADGVLVGIAMATVKVRRTFQEGEKLEGEVEGYTSIQNIRHAETPEKVISQIIGQHRSFDVSDLDDFIEAFVFDVSMEEHYPKLNGFYLDEDRGYNGPRSIRMFLAFNGRALMGVVHRRQLEHTGLKEIKLEGGYFFTILEKQDSKLINSFIGHFNNYVAAGK